LHFNDSELTAKMKEHTNLYGRQAAKLRAPDLGNRQLTPIRNKNIPIHTSTHQPKATQYNPNILLYVDIFYNLCDGHHYGLPEEK
jgi:hypothetical protein